jgi:hypothetical protein
MFCLPQCNAKNKKTTDGFVTEGGLGSLGPISSLLRVLPTLRRSCAATTGVDAEFFLLIHCDISNHNAAGEKVNREGKMDRQGSLIAAGRTELQLFSFLHVERMEAQSSRWKTKNPDFGRPAFERGLRARS